MKNRLYALMMTAMMLFVPFLGVAASNPSELPDDTVIRFPDPNFEVMVRETIGKPTGDITATDVAGIAKLNVSGLYINDLTGIEYFTALTELDCRITELTALDMSQNPLLKALYCDESDLTTLNVSQNPALEVLTCSHIYQLAALDVSQNPALIKLFCSDNQLTT